MLSQSLWHSPLVPRQEDRRLGKRVGCLPVSLCSIYSLTQADVDVSLRFVEGPKLTLYYFTEVYFKQDINRLVWSIRR